MQYVIRRNHHQNDVINDIIGSSRKNLHIKAHDYPLKRVFLPIFISAILTLTETPSEFAAFKVQTSKDFNSHYSSQEILFTEEKCTRQLPIFQVLSATLVCLHRSKCL